MIHNCKLAFNAEMLIKRVKNDHINLTTIDDVSSG